jgi:squalene-hopene/tetraprenyl-beta-curcumene cyclase
MLKKIFCFMIIIAVVCLNGSFIYADEAKLELSSTQKDEIKSSVDRGLKFLRSVQKPDGSWDNHPGLTALAVSAFMRSPRKYTEEDGPFIRNALQYLAGLAKQDGSIYADSLPNYNTALCLGALSLSDNPEYKSVIEKAQDFLVKLQCAEAVGYNKEDKFYGGIGYGSDERPDLANLGFALEALKSSGLSEESKVWENATQFIQRCQNRSESNDQAWAANDGGFVYSPGDSKAGATESYGSMTNTGITSFFYANVKKGDPRIEDAFKWIEKHYTLKENPNMGKQGLYYYYHTLAKALHHYGQPVINDSHGKPHVWKEELAKKLVSLQRTEGHWVNENKRWWEGNKILVTSHAVMALSYLY